MKKTKSLPTISIIIAVIGIFCLGGINAINAQDCRIIRIYATFQPEPSTRLEPETLSIDKGGCVIWINWGRDKVMVNFREGKKCESVTEAPIGFKMMPEDCYVTDFIAMGGTSSLRFVESGTYYYEVIWEEKKDVVQKGSILVRKPKKPPAEPQL